MKKFLKAENLRPPAPRDAIDSVEQALGVKFPEYYRNFLLLTNGYEGFIGENSYVMLWKIEELLEFHHGYELYIDVPGFLLFGSNGAGDAYGFDTRDSKWNIVKLPFIGPDWSLAEIVGATFGEFLKALYEE